MRTIRPLILTLLGILVFNPAAFAADETARVKELDAYWAKVARAVNTGDFALYKSTCHPEGVLVTGIKKQCYPLSKALARWKKEFDDTKAGTRESGLELRFRQRVGDDTTAHETGMFLYTAETADGKSIQEYIHFEALLLKRGGWKVMMEYQKSQGTKAEWDELK
ncbi:MAG: hypothetical protein QGH15_11850 [Kiritimatiellia bacterium]|nr:hypothetical protein [Kiritimatiellia bacterium]